MPMFRTETPSPAAAAIRRILVPVDFSDCSLAALRFATDLGRSLGSEVDVLHVFPVPMAPIADGMMPAAPAAAIQELTEYASKEATRQLGEFLDSVAKEGVGFVQGRLEMGSAYERILGIAKEGLYDLIVMGTHGRTGLSRFFMGSVAERVVRLGPCAVLTIRGR
jgi:nucleotide-binding universal stress UspA family protein